MNDFLYPSNSKIYGKEPQYNESSSLVKKFCQSLGPSSYQGSTDIVPLVKIQNLQLIVPVIA